MITNMDEEKINPPITKGLGQLGFRSILSCDAFLFQFVLFEVINTKQIGSYKNYTI